jgi:DNA-binding NarL/FixJ family response regulator
MGGAIGASFHVERTRPISVEAGGSMTTASDSLRVLVACGQALMAGALKAALVERGFDVVVVRWSGSSRRGSRRRTTEAARPGADVGVLLSDLDCWAEIDAARSVVEGIDVPWVAVTTSEPGPAWGGLLDAGVEVLVPADAGLAEVSDVLAQVAGHELTTSKRKRSELEAAWRAWRSRRQEAASRISSLTPREREVLGLMYAGSSVAEIAEKFEVATETVRTQVKAVLRKLDVKTQLSAVAMLDDVLT